MSKFTVLLKILLCALGLVMAGFGILCYYLSYISGQYTGTTSSAIALELTNWGLAFMLSLIVQLVFICGGVFIFLISAWSILKEYGKCYR